MSPKCMYCGGILVPRSVAGIVVYEEFEDLRRYECKCMACDRTMKITLRGDFPALSATPFQPGRRWYVGSTGANQGRARFWFVILGPGSNDAGKPSSTHKQCRIEIHPDDLRNRTPGYKTHGQVSTYSHKHLKKYAVMQLLP